MLHLKALKSFSDNILRLGHPNAWRDVNATVIASPGKESKPVPLVLDQPSRQGILHRPETLMQDRIIYHCVKLIEIGARYHSKSG